MGRRRTSQRHRRRVGKVSYYFRHGAWHIYYRQAGRQVRRRAGDSEEAAVQIAAQVNAQVSAKAPTLFDFTPLTVSELRQRFLEVVLAAFAPQPPGRRAMVVTPELAEIAVLRRQKQELEAEIVRLRVQLEMATVTQRRGAVAPQKSR